MKATFLMKHKYQTLGNIERYTSFMREFGYDIERLRTDQGTEYSSGAIKDFLRANGIAHAPTGRAAHAQMNVAQRMNRTLTEMERTMLIDAGFLKAWWGHAITYDTTISNRCTTSTFKNKETPFEKFYNREADFKIFRPFRCTEMIYIPLETRTKLDNTSENGIFVGIAEGSLYYKVYCEATKNIVHVRDVTFIEDTDERLFVRDSSIVDLTTNWSSPQNPHPNIIKQKGRPKKTKVKGSTVGMDSGGDNLNGNTAGKGNSTVSGGDNMETVGTNSGKISNDEFTNKIVMGSNDQVSAGPIKLEMVSVTESNVEITKDDASLVNEKSEISGDDSVLSDKGVKNAEADHQDLKI